MGPVVSAKFAEYVRDVALDGILRNRQLNGDLFVRVAGRDEPEHLDLAPGQVVLRGMLSQLGGDLRRYSLLTGMDGADGFQEFSVHMSLQQVSPRTSSKSPQHL